MNALLLNNTQIRTHVNKKYEYDGLRDMLYDLEVVGRYACNNIWKQRVPNLK